MITQEQVEYADSVLSVLQRLVVIGAVAVGAVFFFIRLDHTPSVSMSTELIGVDRCEMKLQLAANNTGQLPLTLTSATIAFVLDDTREFFEQTDLELTAAGGETLLLMFSIPVSAKQNDRIAELKITAQLQEDQDTWRLFDTGLRIAEVPDDC